jgi:pimeloyl-ACP methyl ester carboxylesterase
VQASKSDLERLQTLGFLRPNYGERNYGIFMLRPYQPGKIPVVFVHGLNSSPLAWVETLNELRNDPEFDRRYQFWFFLYPTGEPIAVSNARLRESIRGAIATFDPEGADPAMRDMVVVGHSMGGILARLLAVDSGLAVWNKLIRVPYGQLKGSPETLAQVEQLAIFRPEPYVGRVVCVAAPHRGSPIASEPLGRLVSRLVEPDPKLVKIADELVRENGPDALNPSFRGGNISSVFALREDGPVAASADEFTPDPRIPVHSIILQLGLPPAPLPQLALLPTDGVVPYRSAHLRDARSEVLTRGDHTKQDSVAVTYEIKRILREHIQGR